MAVFCLKLEQIATLGSLSRKPKHLGRKVVEFFSNHRKSVFCFIFSVRIPDEVSRPRDFGKLLKVAMIQAI